MKIFGKAVLLAGSQAVGYGCSFIRNLILARVLAKDDFGLASVFAMTISMLELAGRMSFGKQLIQDRGEDNSNYQRSCQAFQFIAGSLSALLVVTLSWPVAALFDVAHLAWAFLTLGLIPMFRSLQHLDISRFQKTLNFKPAVICESVPQILTTALTFPVAMWFEDFRSVLLLMLIKSGIELGLSHLLAERRYSWKWDLPYFKRMLSFGWPLIANGLVMFFAKQGDQLVIGWSLSLADLASYSVCFSLAGVQWMVFSQVSGTLMLPQLANKQTDSDAFLKTYSSCLDYSAVFALVFCGPLVICGEQIITLLYGASYTGAGPVAAVLSATSALRFLRLAPGIAAMARADTINQLVSGVWRMVNIPLALLIVAIGGGLLEVALCAFFAEILAGSVTVRRLEQRQGISRIVHAKSSRFLVVGLVFAAAMSFALRNSGIGLCLVALIIYLIGLCCVTKGAFPNVWLTIVEGVQRQINLRRA